MDCSTQHSKSSLTHRSRSRDPARLTQLTQRTKRPAPISCCRRYRSQPRAPVEPPRCADHVGLSRMAGNLCVYIYIYVYIYIWEFTIISGSSTTIRTGKLWSASTNMIQIKMLMIINYHLWIIKHLWIRIINICTGNYGKIIESGPSIASWSSFSLAHK